MDEKEWLAYLAGFFDGEGTISIHKHKETTSRGYYFQPFFSVSNTNLEALTFIKNKLGNIGNLHKTSTRKGELEKGWKPAYRLDIGKRSHLLELLPKIIPYLIIKKKQSELLLQFLLRRDRKKRVLRHKNGRFIKGQQIFFDIEDEEIFNKIKNMNKKKVVRNG